MHLGLSRPSGPGAIALLQPPQAVVLLDLAARIPDAEAAVVEFGAAAVLTDGGGKDVDVVIGVPDGDPAAAEVVIRRGDTGGLHDALGNDHQANVSV